MDETIVKPIPIPEIISSLFLWKDIYNSYPELSKALEESIDILLSMNELLIEMDFSKNRRYPPADKKLVEINY